MCQWLLAAVGHHATAYHELSDSFLGVIQSELEAENSFPSSLGVYLHPPVSVRVSVLP